MVNGTKIITKGVQLRRMAEQTPNYWLLGTSFIKFDFFFHDPSSSYTEADELGPSYRILNSMEQET